MDERRKDFFAALYDAGADMPGNKIEKETSEGRQSEDISDQDHVEGRPAACKQGFASSVSRLESTHCI